MFKFCRSILLGAIAAASLAAAGQANAQTLTPIDAGFVTASGTKNLQGPTGNFFSGGFTGGGGEWRGYLTYSVPASGTPYTSAVLNLNVANITFGPNDLLISDVTSDITNDPAATVYADLGGGVSYGTVTGLNTPNDTIQITLNAAGLAAVNAARGSSMSFGFRNTTINNATDDQIFGNSTGSTPRQLILAAAPAPVPTMSEWVMILFGTLLAGGAVLYVQRRRHAA